MIVYREKIERIKAEQLSGFFAGWKASPSSETHLSILRNSSHIVLAIDTESERVIGFINAVSDNVLSVYIPLLEVIPEYRNQGIGRELVGRMLKQLSGFYMIDLCCDESLVEFYQKAGFLQLTAMSIRNYQHQEGKI